MVYPYGRKQVKVVNDGLKFWEYYGLKEPKPVKLFSWHCKKKFQKCSECGDGVSTIYSDNGGVLEICDNCGHKRIIPK